MKIELKDEQVKLLQSLADGLNAKLTSLEAAVRDLIVALEKK